jgi:hypothetical protein
VRSGASPESTANARIGRGWPESPTNVQNQRQNKVVLDDAGGGMCPL